MKNSTKFPYDVKVAEHNRIQLDDDSDHDYFIYKAKVPDGIFYERKYEPVNENLELVADVSCSSTMFRKIIKANSLEEIVIKISKKNIYNRFSIDLITIFKNDCNWDGSIAKKGMPIVHLGSFSINLESRSQGLILFKPNNDGEEVNYSYTQDSIQILLPEKKYNWLLKNKYNQLVKNILSSQFAQIALIEACHLMRDGSNDHLLWQKELKNKWKNFTNEDKEYPDDTDIIQFVNNILESPSKKLLEYIIENDYRDE